MNFPSTQHPPTDAEASVAGFYLRTLIESLKRQGLDADALVQRIGIASLLDDPEQRVPHQLATALWTELEQLTGDDALGLHLAERLRPGAFWVLEYAMRNAATLAEAYAINCRYARLVHTDAVVSLVATEDHTNLSYYLRSSTSFRHAAEFIVATWLVIGRQMTGQHIAPLAVRFRHNAPKNLREHHRILGTDNLQFLSPTNEIVIPAAAMAYPLTERDPKLSVLLDRYAQQLIDAIPTSDDFCKQVRQAIGMRLQTGQTSRADVARSLSVSPRTMHRRLAEHGTTFRNLVNDVRIDLAKRYLREANTSITEVSFLLGFSAQSAFTRAFKRTTGLPPAEYRLLHR